MRGFASQAYCIEPDNQCASRVLDGMAKRRKKQNHPLALATKRMPGLVCSMGWLSPYTRTKLEVRALLIFTR